MEKSYYKNYFVLEKTHWLFRIRKKIFISFIQKYSSAGSKLFDFGCGSGYLIGELQGLGYNAHGADFEKEAIDYGFDHSVRNLKLAIGDKIDYLDGTFDLVTTFDVLEHLENERPTVAELVRVLKPGGKIIVTVPAYEWLWGVQDDVSRHFRRYTEKSLIKVFKNFPELTIIRKTYFNTFLFPLIVVVRLISRWFNIKGRQSDFEINNPFLDAIFYSIFNLEFYFLKLINFPFGVSIILILEKNDSHIE